MTHTPHELAEEFPDKAALIHHLKTRDGEFRFLAEKYHKINRAVHRAECNIEPVSEAHEAKLRKERMWLKDQIARHLSQAVFDQPD